MNSAKVIQHFYENIVPQARCSPGLNEESIANAFLWANFCEQMYCKFLNDAEAVKDLDDQLHSLPNSHAGLSFCFENLKQSNAFLCQSFLQNPNISNDFLKDVVFRIMPSNLDFEKVSLETYELDSLCFELLQSLKLVCLDANKSLCWEIKTELFLDFLKDIMAQLSTEEQHESQLSFVFDTLGGSRETLATVLQILISEASSEIVSEIQNFALNWILLKLLDEKNGFVADFLWEQSPMKLRKIAAKFLLFSSYYIINLTRCASLLFSEYVNFTKYWVKRASASEITLEYEAILEHFEALLSEEDELSEAVRSHLSSLLAHDVKTTIWQDICSRVLP